MGTLKQADMDIGDRIRLKRKENNFTQSQLAEKLYVTQQAVCDWENGKKQPDYVNIGRIVEALHTTSSYLRWGDEPCAIKYEIFNPAHMEQRIRNFSMDEGLDETLRALEYLKEKMGERTRSYKAIGDSENRAEASYIVHPLMMCCQTHAMKISDDAVLATILLHECSNLDIEADGIPFSCEVRHSVEILTKAPGVIWDDTFYNSLKSDRNAALVKVIERCNNLSLASLSFGRQQLEDYVKETEKYIIPLIDELRHEYAELSDTVFILDYQILSEIETIKALLNHCENF